MRQLQVVGISDDGEALLLGQGAGKPSHRLRLDDKLRAAVRGQLAAVGNNKRAESALTPKEMQARLREGATPEDVAKEAGIPVARVLPYAAPVIAERERIVEQARAAVLHRSRGPNGERPLGEVVDVHLNDTAGFKPDSVEWNARRRRDGAWVVVLAYVARGGRRTASWLWRPLERDLTSLDASGTRLATEEPATPRRRAPKPAAKPAKKAAAKKTAPKARKTSRRPAAKKAAPTVKKAAPKRDAATRSAPVRATKAATKAAKPKKTAKPVKAAAKPAAAPKRVKAAPAAKRVKTAPAARPVKATRKPAKQVRTRRPVRSVAPVEDTAPMTRPTVVPDPVIDSLAEAPTPIIVIPRPEPEPEPEPEVQAEPIVARRPGQRVPLPSWSDVLLGVSTPENSRDGGAKRPRKSG